MSKLADIEYDDWFEESDTDKAHLFLIDGKEVWIPKSLAEVDKDSKTITVPEWWALKEGLI